MDFTLWEGGTAPEHRATGGPRGSSACQWVVSSGRAQAADGAGAVGGAHAQAGPSGSEAWTWLSWDLADWRVRAPSSSAASSVPLSAWWRSAY